MRALARWTVFPVTLAAFFVPAWWAVEAGVSPAALLLPVAVLSMLAVALIERVLPYREAWNHSRGDLAADALYLPTTFGVNGLLDPLVATAAVGLGGWLSREHGAGLWPGQWPLLGQVALAVVVAELFDYWGHRVMHENRWLWRLHATHHSSGRLYWLNATRAHPGEMVFRGFIGALPLAVLGASEGVLALVAVFAIVAGLFQHANVDFALGPFSWVFSIGDLHRWHHSRHVQEANTNYGNTFIFWDAVFGTRFLPEGREPPDRIGIEGLDAFPRRFGAQLLSPFRWRRIEEESVALAVAPVSGR